MRVLGDASQSKFLVDHRDIEPQRLLWGDMINLYMYIFICIYVHICIEGESRVHSSHCPTILLMGYSSQIPEALVLGCCCYLRHFC